MIPQNDTEIRISIQRAVGVVHIIDPESGTHFWKQYESIAHIASDFEKMRLKCNIKARLFDMSGEDEVRDTWIQTTICLIDPTKLGYIG